MADYGVFSPQDARMILDAVRWLKASGMMTQSGRKSPGTFMPETPAYAKNVSGETIPAYACVQCVGTLELGGQNYVEIDQPADTDGTAGPFLFNGHNEIQPDEFGKLDESMELRALSTVTDAGKNVHPEVGSWELVESAYGIGVVVGEDEIGDNVIRIVRNGKGSKLFRFTLNENWSAGVADADILHMDGTDTGIDADVEDPESIFEELNSGDSGLCLCQDGRYYVIQAPCP